MTVTTIQEFRCPACGHPMGQEEYKHVCEKIGKLIETTADTQVEKLKKEYNHIIQERDKEHQQEIQKREKLHNQEVETKVSQQVQLQLKEYEKKAENERAIVRQTYEEKLRKKDEEIEAADKIKQAIRDNEQTHRQIETQYKEHISRIEKENFRIKQINEKQKKIIENISPELRGTSGEINLFDDLHKAFPKDEIIPKRVGIEMADVVQTIVTENGEKVAPPIAWDNKVKEKVEKDDIDKAKRYKTIHNTDYSVIVTATDIADKNSSNSLIERREGVWLVNRTIVVETAKLLRSFIIRMAKITISNKGRTSKQVKLYERMTSTEYTRTIQQRRVSIYSIIICQAYLYRV